MSKGRLALDHTRSESDTSLSSRYSADSIMPSVRLPHPVRKNNSIDKSIGRELTQSLAAFSARYFL